MRRLRDLLEVIVTDRNKVLDDMGLNSLIRLDNLELNRVMNVERMDNAANPLNQLLAFQRLMRSIYLNITACRKLVNSM